MSLCGLESRICTVISKGYLFANDINLIQTDLAISLLNV